jgi:GNAT superfamily N-acetyltransferase
MLPVVRQQSSTRAGACNDGPVARHKNGCFATAIHAMTHLHRLLEAWTAGWAHSRGTPPPQPRAYGFELHVGLPGHVARHALPVLDVTAIHALAHAIEQPGILLKVCAPADEVAQLLPAGWRMTAVNTLMSASLKGAQPVADLPEGVSVSQAEASGPVRSITVQCDAVQAASGRVGLHGSYAVFDQIETVPGFQRRGLGRLVMRRLSECALRAGATRGVLVATEAGRGLYTAIGWHVESPLTTAERID